MPRHGLMDIGTVYVSGILPDVERDAPIRLQSHAWAESSRRRVGWVGFDPATDMSPDLTAYVSHAYGLILQRDAARLIR